MLVGGPIEKVARRSAPEEGCRAAPAPNHYYPSYIIHISPIPGRRTSAILRDRASGSNFPDRPELTVPGGQCHLIMKPSLASRVRHVYDEFSRKNGACLLLLFLSCARVTVTRSAHLFRDVTAQLVAPFAGTMAPNRKRRRGTIIVPTAPAGVRGSACGSGLPAYVKNPAPASQDYLLPPVF